MLLALLPYSSASAQAAAPTSLVATPVSTTKISLTWSAPVSVGLPIQNYRVFRGATSSNLTQVATVAQSAYTDGSLSPATRYYYGVEAAYKSGNVSLMSAIVPTTTPRPPAAPASVAATAVSATKIGLKWSTAGSGGLPVQYYHVFRGSSAANLSQVAVVTQTSYTDTSVKPAVTYYYAVQAADTGADLSPTSAIVSAKTQASPAAPTNLVATPASTSKIGLTWSAAVSGGLPIQDYLVYRGTTSSNLSQFAIALQTTYTDSTVAAGTTYYYAIAATDTAADVSPMSAIVTAIVPFAPSAPTGLLATPVSNTTISLTWSAPTSGGLPIQNYRVFRGTTSSNLSQMATVAQPAYTDASGSPATTYYYGVEAADKGGDLSAMSATASATTLALPAAPTGLQ